MSEADYENLMKIYGWKSPINPFLYIVIIFLLIAIFLLIPYIYIQMMKQRKKYWLNEWKKMRKEKNEDKLKESGVDMLLVTI
jgi:hypothetical protein